MGDGKSFYSLLLPDEYDISLLVTRGMATGDGLSPGSVYYVVTMGMGLS